MSEQIPAANEQECAFRDQLIDHMARLSLLGASIDYVETQEAYKSADKERILRLLLESMLSFVPPKSNADVKAAMAFFLQSNSASLQRLSGKSESTEI